MRPQNWRIGIMLHDDNTELWECDTCNYKESNYERMQRTFVNMKFNLSKTNEKSNKYITCNKALFANVFYGFEALIAFNKIRYYAGEILVEAEYDLEDSFQLCKIGKYKIAFSMLRSVIEQVIRFLHHDMHYEENPDRSKLYPIPTKYRSEISPENLLTAQRSKSINKFINELKKHENFKKYMKEYNNNLFIELYSSDDSLYDRLSKYVHTSTIDKFTSSMLEEGLIEPINYYDNDNEFSKKYIKLWFTYADKMLKLLIPIMTLYQTSVLITNCECYDSRINYEEPSPEKPKILHKDYTESIKYYLKLQNEETYKNLQKICDEDPCNIIQLENYRTHKSCECNNEKEEIINRRKVVREIEKTGKHPKEVAYKI